jgi:hypothetical protein
MRFHKGNIDYLVDRKLRGMAKELQGFYTEEDKDSK